MKKKNCDKVIALVIEELKRMEFGDEIRIKNTESGFEVNSSKKIKQSREKRIYELLEELSIPNLNGYNYIKEAIMYCLERDYKPKMQKEIYPEIAKMFGTTSYIIERGIRYSKECSLKKRVSCEEIFDKRIPTNSEFIYSIVEKIKKEENTL